MKNLLLAFIVSLLFFACTEKENSRVIFIVRHAEKEAVQDPDPELSPEGEERAAKLAQILKEQDIQAIYSTDYKRTQLTAQPTAAQAGIGIESYDPRNHDALVELLKQSEGNSLVVGHSNTVSRLANYFVGEGENFEDLQDSEYDFIYEVHLHSEGNTVLRKVYADY